MTLSEMAFRAGCFGIAAALGCGCVATIGVAEELQEAIESVNQASDDELLTELQRRHEDRRDISATLKKGIDSRDIKTGLGKFDDVTFNKALRAAEAGGRVIYGPDDRKDWYEINDNLIKKLAGASVALFTRADLQPASSDSVKLRTTTLGESQGLCNDETFRDQRVGAWCSGTLVTKDVVLTAGHCVREISNDPRIPYIGSVSFVFGYRVEIPGSPGVTEIPRDHTFSGGQVLAGELEGDRGRDWALVKLAHPVSPSIAEPVTGWWKDVATKDQDVFVIGYPSGLPVKFAPGASIREASNETYFTANLDTFGGNSGSGVYDAATNQLIGILVRGDTDYVRDEQAGCVRANMCPTSGCRGEDVTRISLVPSP